MKTTFYTIRCLTNMHVGSGDANYNIVDNEVETDPVTGYPMIHASGVKGALREHMKADANVNKIFGEAGTGDSGRSGSGTHKFMDAYMLARPMRVENSDSFASVLVTSIAAVNDYLRRLTAFGANPYGVSEVTAPDFGGNEFLLYTKESGDIRVEGERTARFIETDATLQVLKAIFKEEKSFALVRDMNAYELPVVARNCVQPDKRNLWYERLVPHGTVFYFAIISPDDAVLTFENIVQFGGNASIGCGYCTVKEATVHE